MTESAHEFHFETHAFGCGYPGCAKPEADQVHWPRERLLTAIDELEAENGALKMIISSAEPLCARATACGAILREVYEIGKGTSA